MTPTVGSTLFSFTDEWRAGHLSLEHLLGRIAALGLGPDVELVGYQSFKGLPSPTAAEVETFRRCVTSLRLRPTVFGVYVDRAKRPTRWLTVEESTRELVGQLETASRLGFSTLRATLGMDTEIIDRVVPVLDDLGLILTFEVQGNHTPSSADVLELVSWLEASPGAPVGITLDSSVAMPGLPVTYRRTLCALGLTDREIVLLDEAWRGGGQPFTRLHGYLETIGRREVAASLREHLVTAFVRFGHGRLEQWRHVLPWVRHAHAKFWDWEEANLHVREPHGAFVDMLVTSGYEGSISSEFGGTAWLERPEVDVFDLTRKHVELLRSAVVERSLAADTIAVPGG